MRWTIINSIAFSSMTFLVVGDSARALEPPSRLRVPNDAILREPSEPIESADSIPIRVSFQSETNSNASRKHYVVLGTRDDSMADEYPMDGIRGSETPAGPRTGRYCQPGMERAGHPWCISKHASPSLGPDYQVGYVGGGTPFSFGGESRKSNEGTFGLDYSGLLFSRKTWLYWTHGRRYQGGAGRYETEGPRILPEKE